ncbi:hypothetical protein Tco_0735358 [Tanacetum coccineum]
MNKPSQHTAPKEEVMARIEDPIQTSPISSEPMLQFSPGACQPGSFASSLLPSHITQLKCDSSSYTNQTDKIYEIFIRQEMLYTKWSRFGTCSHGHLVMDAITEKYDASSVPTALMPLDICHKPMNMPFLKVVSLLGMDVINLARTEAKSGTWIELDTSVPLMDGQAWERTVSIYGSDQQVRMQLR